jgi:hypothetical protein
MTAAVELLATLRARGVVVEPRGDRLRVRPASVVAPEELDALRRHKAELLALLTGGRRSPLGGTWYAHPWPDALADLGVRHVGPFDQCADCQRWSWARYGGVVLCLACARRRAAEAPM